MTVVLVEGGEIKQVWRDVKTPAELKKRYGLQGVGYRAVPEAVVGQIEQNGGFVNPPPTPRVPQPNPDLITATQDIIDALTASGMDMTDAQTAMDRQT